jgi:hypothetical protein
VRIVQTVENVGVELRFPLKVTIVVLDPSTFEIAAGFRYSSPPHLRQLRIFLQSLPIRSVLVQWLINTHNWLYLVVVRVDILRRLLRRTTA